MGTTKGKKRCIDCKGWFDLAHDDDIGYMVTSQNSGWLKAEYVEGPICKRCWYAR